MAQSGPPVRKNFDRFIYYFAGIAVGCLMLGVFQQVRAAKQRAQAPAVTAPKPVTPSGAPASNGQPAAKGVHEGKSQTRP